MNSPAWFIDHTLLRPDSTPDGIQRLCAAALEHNFASNAGVGSIGASTGVKLMREWRCAWGEA